METSREELSWEEVYEGWYEDSEIFTNYMRWLTIGTAYEDEE
jgi:hypothetical protein